MQNPFSLEGKTILITGASSGIGITTCKMIDQMGGRCIGIGRNLTEFKKAFPGEKHLSIEFDLTNLGLIEQLVEKLELIDGYVHAAGIVDINPIKFFKPELYERIRKTNLDSYLYILSFLLRKKKIKRNSSIVMVSSISGSFGAKGYGLYGITKAGLDIAAKTYANELANQKIRVNTIAPGMVRTKIALDTSEKLGDDQINIDEAKYPLGYGDPEDVANPIIFLLSEASKWITGQVIVIDGGRTATV